MTTVIREARDFAWMRFTRSRMDALVFGLGVNRMLKRIIFVCCLAVSVCTNGGSCSGELVRLVRQADPQRVPRVACQSPESLGYQTKTLSDLSLDIRIDSELMPEDCAKELFHEGALRRQWQHAEFNWAASDLFAQPAYFDDPILERYGQSHDRFIQPVLSGAHFFSQFPLMPYKLGLDRTHDHVYTLGYYRPGSPMPYLGRRLPLEADAAAFESMSWVALFLIFP